MPDQYGNYNGTYGVPGSTPNPPASIPGPGGALVAGFAAGQNIGNKAVEAYRGGKQYQAQQVSNAGKQAAQDALAQEADPAGFAKVQAARQAASIHPSVLDAISHGARSALTGLTNLFSGGSAPSAAPATTQPAPAQTAPTPAPATMSAGGAVRGALPFVSGRPMGRQDSNMGSTGATFEPRLAREHGGTMPTWKGTPRSTAGGDGGASLAPGDDIHPPGDSPDATKIINFDQGGTVPVEKPTYADAVKDRVVEVAKSLTGGMLGDTIKKVQDHNDRNAAPMDMGGVVPAPNQNPEEPGGPGTAAGVLGMATGGIVPGDVDGIDHGASGRGMPVAMDAGGAIPGPGGALVSGVAAGQNIADSATQAARGGTQYSEQQDARAGLQDTVEKLATHWQAHTLNDVSVPNKDQAVPAPADVAPSAGPASTPAPDAGAAPAGAPPPAAAGGPAGAAPPAQGAIPSPPAGGTAAPAQPADPNAPIDPQVASTAAALKTAAADPASQQGIPQKSAEESGQPHSLGPDFWDHQQMLMLHASALAAKAGEDPQKTYESLVAVRNGFFQANVAKNLSAANIALQAGNMDAVEKAMKNVYYYFPDGKELTVKRDAQGNVLYQDPISPFVDDKGDPTNAASTHDVANRPNMVPITAQHLQILGEAALDPQKVGQTIASMRAAAVEAGYKSQEGQAKVTTANAEMLKAKAAEVTSQGNYLKGEGINFEGQAHLQLVASQAYKNGAEGKKALMAAKWLEFRTKADAKGEKMDPFTTNQVDSLDKLIKEGIQGPTVPDTKEKVGGIPNANYGKETHDISRANPVLAHAPPEDLPGIHALAASIIVANRGMKMTAAQALDSATKAYSAGKGHPIIGQLPDGTKTLHVPKKPGADPKNANDWVNVRIGDATADTIQRTGTLDVDPAEIGLFAGLVGDDKPGALEGAPSVNSVAARAEPDTTG